MSAPTLPISRRANGALEWSPVAVSELRPNEQNPRSISRQRFDDLVYSLRQDPDMLQVRPIVALPDGRVIMGNMRLRAAIELGWDTIPTSVVDLDEERAKQWLVRDNVPYGEWEEDGLAELMYELNQAGSDMRLTGYDADMIKKLLQSVAPDESDPAGGPGTATPTGRMLAIADVTMQEPSHAVERGEVYRVGPHVLVCAGVYDGWHLWSELLAEGVLFVPYPSPAAPLSSRANHHRLLLVQPDTFVCGHLLDSYATLVAEDQVALVDAGEDPWGG